MIRGHNEIFFPLNYFMGFEPLRDDQKPQRNRRGSKEASKVIMALLT